MTTAAGLNVAEAKKLPETSRGQRGGPKGQG